MTRARLLSVRDAMRDAIRAGLAEPDREIKALPAFLGLPPRGLSGDAVVLDVGGTHARAARIGLDRGTGKMLGREIESRIMERAQRAEIGRDEFFAEQARLIAEASPETRLRIGYCFSYPARITPEREAVLIDWTKGIRVADTVGRPVGKLLTEALARYGRTVAAVPVLNDTVASLIAGAALAPDCDHHIGLIVGTGTNMAGYFPLRGIAKLGAAERAGWRDDEAMAVNLESGEFNPPGVLTAWDDALDASLRPEQRGKQRFEKTISGAYLPKLLWQIVGREACDDAGCDIADPRGDAGTVAALRDHPVVGAAATAILDRSADLVAAGLAGLLEAYGAGGKETGVLVEGTPFHKTEGYAERVWRRVAELAPEAAVRPIPLEAAGIPANLLGAACAALTHRDNRS